MLLTGPLPHQEHGTQLFAGDSKMEVTDFESTQRVTTVTELSAALAKRTLWGNAQVNSFHLNHDSMFPMLLILVRDNLASLCYTHDELVAGYISVGSVKNLPSDADFTFWFFGERLRRPNETVITFEEAMRAAEDFLVSDGLPGAVEWQKI